MIILASRSPQRRALLRAIGVEHRVVASGYGEEDVADVTPDRLVALHAGAKAADVAARSGVPRGGAVLAADTAVVLDGRVLGKPVDRVEAAAMLGDLAGVTHRVVTGVCLRATGRTWEWVESAEVTFAAVTRAHLEWYLDRGEWQGRAGGYAIQGSGATLVERVDGDFTTVVGLPVGGLCRALAEAGLAPWSPPGGG